MRLLLAFFLLALPAITVPTDGPPAGFEHWTASSLKETGQSLKTKALADPGRNAVARLADYPNELFLLAGREGDGKPELHETQADIFVVESGSATLLVGGTLEGAETVSPHELRSGTIRGGARIALNPGDVVRIPANVPHQLLPSGSFTYLVVKVKGY